MDIEKLSAQELTRYLQSASGTGLVRRWVEAQDDPDQLRALIEQVRIQAGQKATQTIRISDVKQMVSRWGRLDDELIDYLLDQYGGYGKMLGGNPHLQRHQKNRIVQQAIDQTEQAASSDVMELRSTFKTVQSLIDAGHHLQKSARKTFLKWVQHPKGQGFHIRPRLRDVVFMDRHHQVKASGGALFLVRDPETPYQNLLTVAQNAGISEYTFWAIGTHPRADSEILATLYDRIQAGRGRHGLERPEEWFRQLQQLTDRLTEQIGLELSATEQFRLQLARARAHPELQKLVDLVHQTSAPFQTRAFLALARQNPQVALQTALQIEGLEPETLARSLGEEDQQVRETIIRSLGNIDPEGPKRT